MKKSFTAVLAALVLFACDKSDPPQPEVTYDEIFQISFKLNGKEYSKVLAKNEKNGGGGSKISDAQGNYMASTGPVFSLDSGYTAQINFGYIPWLQGDTTGNFQRTKELLGPGNKAYQCLRDCGTGARNGVEVSIRQGNGGVFNWWWSSTRTDTANNDKPIPVTDEQNGSSFVITEIKESTTTGYNRNAVIIKGTFYCNLFESEYGTKKVLTDGKFTCIVAAW